MSKSKTIILKDLCGEFCTTRNNQGIEELKFLLKDAIKNKITLIFDRTGIKIFGISFVDELFCQIMLDNKIKNIDDISIFNPPLEDIYREQLNRGIKLRDVA